MEHEKDLKNREDGLDQILELGSDLSKTEKGNVYTLTIIGQVEGHQILPETCKTTKYEHVLPLLADNGQGVDISLVGRALSHPAQRQKGLRKPRHPGYARISPLPAPAV